MIDKITDELSHYLLSNQQELMNLLLTLCKIPAPSNQEELRADFIKKWLEEAGATNVYIDDALNVVFPYHCENDGPINVLMAHTDTVFPDLEPFEVTIEDDKIKCPGVGDDTANVAILLFIIKYVLENNLIPPEGILFVANSGEEGLGNLKGCRQIMKDYGKRTKEFTSFDGTYDKICNYAVGSKRYQVTVKTEGGHSYGAFGNRNAIHLLSTMIGTLYTLKVPAGGKSSYNVGLIEGGTSVNTIAQEATMLFEYRSDVREHLASMDSFFHKMIDSYRAMNLEIVVELVGDRPCMGDVNPEQQQQLENTVLDIIEKHTGQRVKKGSGSTDCNIPFSMGIPSVCFGGYLGFGAHTREEYIEVSSLSTGSLIVGEYIMKYFNINKDYALHNLAPSASDQREDIFLLSECASPRSVF